MSTYPTRAPVDKTFDTTYRECSDDAFARVAFILKWDKEDAAIPKLRALFASGVPANGYCVGEDGTIRNYLGEAKRVNNEAAVGYLIDLNYQGLLEAGWLFNEFLWEKQAISAPLRHGHSFAKEIADPTKRFWFQAGHLGPEYFQAFCDCGARFDVPVEIDSVSYLPIVQFMHYSAIAGVPETLIVNAADPNVQQADGQSILHGAVRQGTVISHTMDAFGNIERLEHITKAFVAAGGDIDLVDNEGRSALIVACSLGYFEKAQVLLEAGANPALKDKSGMTPEDFITMADRKDLLPMCAAARAKNAIKTVLASACPGPASSKLSLEQGIPAP